MSRNRYKIILSDLHWGFGSFNTDGTRNLLEEFHYDSQFVEFLQYYCQGDYAKAEVELILNGDILNHLHTDPEDPDCDSMTERVALERTEKIIAGHPACFQALSEFAKFPRRRILYLMGNHDLGVAWPKVQQLLKEKIDSQLIFILDSYEADAIRVEHGNRFLADNRVDLDNLFLTRGEQDPLLKMPWGSFFAIHFINPLKKKRPYIGKVYPFKMYLGWSLTHDTGFALKTIFQLVLYFLKINFIRNPKRNFSWWDTFKILREFSFPFDLDAQAQKLLKDRPDLKLVSFGHTHHARCRQFARGQEYINTGTWNEKIGLDLGSLGRELRFTFAEVLLTSEGKMNSLLKEWKGTYRAVEDLL